MAKKKAPAKLVAAKPSQVKPMLKAVAKPANESNKELKKPIAKKPAAKNSATKKPAAKNPVAKKPMAKKPAAKNPVAKKPMAKKPAAKNPIAKPSAEKKTMTKMAAKKPASKKPAEKKNDKIQQEVKNGGDGKKDHHHPKEPKEYNYYPLIVVVLFTLIAALGLTIREGEFSAMDIMNNLMAFFLIFLALFKFQDTKEFEKSFIQYDLVAKKYHSYAKIYPGLEFFIGFMFLTGVYNMLFLVMTLIVMSSTTIGILKEMNNGKAVKCACMGSFANLPLSIISFLEVAAMIVIIIFNMMFMGY